MRNAWDTKYTVISKTSCQEQGEQLYSSSTMVPIINIITIRFQHNILWNWPTRLQNIGNWRPWGRQKFWLSRRLHFTTKTAQYKSSHWTAILRSWWDGGLRSKLNAPRRFTYLDLVGSHNTLVWQGILDVRPSAHYAWPIQIRPAPDAEENVSGDRLIIKLPLT
jgi:hypothetical protein